MNISERVFELMNGKPYDKCNRKEVNLTDAEEEIIVNSMNEFKDNINPNIFLSSIALNRVNALINRNDYKHMTVRECRTVCEALYDVLYRKNYFNLEADKAGKDISNINNLFIKMQQYAEYNFLKQLEKCSRSHKSDDIGEGAFELLSEGYKK